MSFIADELEPHIARSDGKAHCVALVRAGTGAPHTSQWRRGQQVRGNNVPWGTAIATFDPDGKYGNHTDGRSHAAILIKEQPDGLLVLDQWIGRVASRRVIRFKNGAGPAVDDGDQYHVIET